MPKHLPRQSSPHLNDLDQLAMMTRALLQQNRRQAQALAKPEAEAFLHVLCKQERRFDQALAAGERQDLQRTASAIALISAYYLDDLMPMQQGQTGPHLPPLG